MNTDEQEWVGIAWDGMNADSVTASHLADKKVGHPPFQAGIDRQSRRIHPWETMLIEKREVRN